MIVRLHCMKCGKKFTVADESKAVGQKCRYCKMDLIVANQENIPAKTSSAKRSVSKETGISHDQAELPVQIGRYQIRTQLGAGAFGRVYRAYDPNLERDVALKVLHPERLGDHRTAERFLREAAAGARLRHSYIVPVYDFSTHGEQWFIVAAYIKGQTLKEALEIGAWDFRQSAEAVRKLAIALHHAHSEGIVHRDVKPANILIDEKGDPQLTDFGLASLQDASFTLTQSGAALGTPAYMAPEQYLGAKDKSVDQFSLGVLFFEMLCGERPFTGHPAARGLIDPPSMRTYNSNIPTKLEAICLRALAKKPEDRYPHCQAFADAIQSWVDDHLISNDKTNLLSVNLLTQDRLVPPDSRPSWHPTQVAELPKIDSRDVAQREHMRWVHLLNRDASWTNEFGVRFRLVPPGRFRMGAVPGDPHASSNEKPPQTITVPTPFYVATFPLTNGTVRNFLERANSADGADVAQLLKNRAFAYSCRSSDIAADLPAVEISAQDAMVLCRWMSQRDNRRYRLPTEAEWEYLARAGVCGLYWWEEGLAAAQRAVFGSKGPAASDERRANVWGLSDVLGNVAEWTSSKHGCLDSDLPSKPAASCDNTLTVRGGSWRDTLEQLRLSRRLSMNGAARKDWLGVRLVCEVGSS